MNNSAFDDARADDPNLDGVEDFLIDAAEPIAPPPELRAQILNAITEEPQVSSLRRPAPKARMFVAAAASVVALAGIGIWATNFSDFGFLSPPTSHTTRLNRHSLDEIMTATDVQSGNGQAMGAQLEIAVSKEMGKGGLMVNGAPKLDDGMGAQVWAVMENGDMKSAGVIDQSPHTDVWMPLPAETTKVMITEEPMSGSASPEGTVLEEVTLA
ncbi:MAG: anti-sigma factor [Corynebacterium sp.]|nr:anti-sigma factor [Corynebacterium sp.]